MSRIPNPKPDWLLESEAEEKKKKEIYDVARIMVLSIAIGEKRIVSSEEIKRCIKSATELYETILETKKDEIPRGDNSDMVRQMV